MLFPNARAEQHLHFCSYMKNSVRELIMTKQLIQKTREKSFKIRTCELDYLSDLVSNTPCRCSCWQKKTPGRKESTVHYLPLLPKSYLSSSAVVIIRQLPDMSKSSSFMKLVSIHLNAEYIICPQNLKGIWCLISTLMSRRIRGCRALVLLFMSLDFIFILFPDTLQRSRQTDSFYKKL